jgi:tetratricopeptide (TPR) repeat protein
MICGRFVSAVLLGILPAGASLAQDQVFVKTGPPVSGDITGLSVNELEIKTRQGPRKIASRDIVKLGFNGEPNEVRTARIRMAAGQFEEALALLRRIDASAVSRPEQKVNLAFLNAMTQARIAMTGGGDKSGAASALVDFVKANGDSVHYYTACETLGELAFSMGRYDVADQFFEKVAAAPWKDYELRAKRLKAQSLYGAGKYEEARAVYGQVLDADADDAACRRQKLMSEVGQAVCEAQIGDIDEAMKRLHAVIKGNDPSDSQLFGRTYNALGVSYIKAGRPEDALLAFLHVDLLFSKDVESHAEALYHLQTLWVTAKKSDRAVEAKNRLQQEYGGTVWASKK